MCTTTCTPPQIKMNSLIYACLMSASLTSGHKIYQHQQVLINLNDDGDLIADILASTDSIE